MNFDNVEFAEERASSTRERAAMAGCSQGIVAKKGRAKKYQSEEERRAALIRITVSDNPNEKAPQYPGPGMFR